MENMPRWLMGPWTIVLVAVAFYANTLANRFALDDGLVLTENTYVAKGIAGIPDILAHDSFHGSIGTSAYLSGGRYRPLSLVTYAVEVSLFGIEPIVHHAVNVLLFALNCLVLLRFLQRFVFVDRPWLAWCTTLLFAIHPVHTEVVANIKGRDELLSLLFLLLTLHHALAHIQWRSSRNDAAEVQRAKKRHRSQPMRSPGKWSGVLSVVFFVLALLSKENGLIFIVILPLTIYFLTGENLKGAVIRSLPVIGLVAIYFLSRIMLLDARNNEVTEIMDNPYLLATAGEKLGTILYVHWRYLGLLFWPHPLTYDYSFHTIPYRALTDPLVLVSSALHMALFTYACIAFRRKEVLAYCILFYLASLFLVSNLVFNIGAPMAERFLYQASVPFLIGCVELLHRAWSRMGEPRRLMLPLAALLVLATAASGYAIVERNTHWRTGDELFLHDVGISPNSARTNTFAGIALIHASDSARTPAEKRAHALEATRYFMVADSIHRNYMPTLLNMGLAYYRLDSMDTAEMWWDRARLKDPKDAKLMQLDAFLFDRYYRGGVAAGVKGAFPEAMAQLEKALKYAPMNANAWYDLGGICYNAKEFARARRAWERTLILAPEHAQARQGMAALNAQVVN